MRQHASMISPVGGGGVLRRVSALMVIKWATGIITTRTRWLS